jgi:hypothetical protein
MTVEVLYVPGCPNYQPAVERLQRVLASQSVREEIRSVLVSTEAQTKTLLFPGSPTIRVNGEDVEPNQTGIPGMACRLYANRTGVPSEEVLKMAIVEAQRKE